MLGEPSRVNERFPSVAHRPSTQAAMTSHDSYNLLDLAACEVVRRYPLSAVPLPLGPGSGFSGARLWRITDAAGAYCLRVWPGGDLTLDRVRELHRLMALARQSGLTFVPCVLQTRSGATWVNHVGRLWEITAWMPGQADFHARPTLPRLEAACAALALLHAVWGKDAVTVGPCPAVFRRLDAARAWLTILDSGWVPNWTQPPHDPVALWASRAWSQVVRRIRELPERLQPWTQRSFPLQTCHCDVWHNHVLFDGAVVSGMIDFGSVKIDHVAVDLARLLGSLVADDVVLRAAGLAAYRRLRPLTLEEEALVQVLDETGTIVGLANWLKWLYREPRRYADRAAVARKLAELVERAEKWTR